MPASIIEFISTQQSAFDSSLTKAMGDAYDAACADLQVSIQNDLVKEVIAKRLIRAAKLGEKDTERLYAKALDAVGLSRRHF